MFNKFLLATAVCGLGCGLAAHADTINVTLNSTATATGLTCSTTNPCGTITITDITGGVQVMENIAPDFFVVTGNGTNHVSLAMDLDATPTSYSNFSSLPTGLSWTTGTNPTPAGYSTFDFSQFVTLSGCTGGSCPQVSTLSFDINGVTTANFDLTSPFVSDVSDGTNTGNVAGFGTLTPTTTATPEPSSLALLGSGVLGLAGVVRRKFRKA